MINNKKAQTWIIDLLGAILIFSIGAVIALRIVSQNIEEDEFAKLRKTAFSLSEQLMGEGNPKNWTNETIVRIGLTTNNKLNKTKTEQFFNMNYNETRIYMNNPYEYLVFFKNNETIINFTNCSQGQIKISCNLTEETSITTDYSNLAKITRMVAYNNSIIEMVLYLWK